MSADTILWRGVFLPGHEIAALVKLTDGWELVGTALLAHEGQPCRLDYRVSCDHAWATRKTTVRGSIGSRPVDLLVTVDASGRWRVDGADVPAVAGCIDVDLGFSPSTNLLPIRRLDLAPGEAADVRAAWLPFPSLELEPLPQRYVRESETTYRYESRGGQFTRVLQVDPSGFVLSYPGIWEAEGVLR